MIRISSLHIVLLNQQQRRERRGWEFDNIGHWDKTGDIPY